MLSYRYGYAEFSSSQEAKKAMESMAGGELGGRQLRLDLATPRTPGGGGGGGRGTPRGGRGTPRGGRGGMCASVFVFSHMMVI